MGPADPRSLRFSAQSPERAVFTRSDDPSVTLCGETAKWAQAQSHRKGSAPVDHDGAHGKIMKTSAIRRNDQRRQRKGHQQCPEQRSWQTERLRI